MANVIHSATKADGFGHPFVRFIPGKDGRPGTWVESVVYNKETGKRVLCWPVDARELVASGEWSYDQPGEEEGTVPPPAPAVDTPAPKSRRAARGT